MADEGVAAAGGHPDSIARAHQALLQQHDLQFDFVTHPPLPPPPDWLILVLKAISHVMVALAPVFKVIFWVGLIVAVVAILVFMAKDFSVLRGFRRKPKSKTADLNAEWRPTAARARTLLADADRLAAEGRFGEAVHLLLFRSIDDIDQRWPNLVRPALTSRDIAAHPELPDAARRTFAGLAEVVERSFFGAAPVDAADFDACRGAYAAFALPGSI